MIEFGVYSWEFQGESGHVDGRCHLGNLAIGTMFTEFCDKGGASYEVQLTVVEIVAYQHSLSEIDEGFTARLQLHGKGWESLRDRGILRSGS